MYIPNSATPKKAWLLPLLDRLPINTKYSFAKEKQLCTSTKITHSVSTGKFKTSHKYSLYPQQFSKTKLFHNTMKNWSEVSLD